MSKHTFGPWQVAPDGFRVFNVPPEGVGLTYIASTGWNAKSRTSAAKANARLIAAAPELLDLAKKFEATSIYYIAIDKKNGDDEGAKLKTLTLNIIRAAIAKAEARS